MIQVKIENVDITNLLKQNGFEITRNDIDGSSAGRNMQGTLIRDRIATKYKIKLTCRPLTTSELRTFLNLIEPSSFWVTITNIKGSGTLSMRMYCSTVPVSFLINKGGESADLWSGLSFNLIEL